MLTQRIGGFSTSEFIGYRFNGGPYVWGGLSDDNEWRIFKGIKPPPEEKLSAYVVSAVLLFGTIGQYLMTATWWLSALYAIALMGVVTAIVLVAFAFDTAMRRNHGAEHKVYEAILAHRTPSLEDVFAASRVSDACGGMAYPFLVLCMTVTAALFGALGLPIFLAIFAMEPAIWLNRRYGIVYRVPWLYRLGRKLQLVTTMEPTAREIGLAIVVMNAMLNDAARSHGL